jgi:GNAT superfamily N-acetyltransferase
MTSNSITPTVRRAEPGDAAALAALNRVVQELHRLRRPDQFRAASTAEITAWYAAVFSRPTAAVWLAEASSRAVGYLLTEVHHRPENPFSFERRWLELDQLAVEPGYRRQGVARALVATALADARSQGIHTIEVTAWAFNDDMQAVLRALRFTLKTNRFELHANTRSSRRVT